MKRPARARASNVPLRYLLIGCGGLIAVGLCLGIAAGAYFFLNPPAPPQPAAAAPELLVVVTDPLNGSSWPLYTSIPVYSTAVTDQPLSRMELWVDGVLVEKQDSPSHLTAWSWTALQPGTHTIVVIAADTAGHVGVSNGVTLNTSNPPTGFVEIHVAQEGDTVEAVAAALNTTPQDILQLNPTLDPAAPIAPDTPIKVPVNPVLPAPVTVTPPSPPPDGPTQPPVIFAPNPFINLTNLITPPIVPAMPGLGVGVKGCDANVLISDQSDNEDGFYVYRLNAENGGFERLATLGANSDKSLPIQFVDESAYGSLTYYVSAFNAAGETKSILAGTKIEASDCLTPFWKGFQIYQVPNFSFATSGNNGGGGLTPNGSNLPPLSNVGINIPPVFDKTYVYFSQDGKNWQRVPPSPNEFIVPPNGFFDLDEALKDVKPPTQGQITLEIDAWGWQGAQLIHIGRFQRVLAADVPDKPIESGQLEICNAEATSCGQGFGQFGIEEVGSTSYNQRRLLWTPPPGITQGLWQVSALPYTGECDVNASGVLLSGNLNTTYTPYEFDIDLAPIKTDQLIVNGSLITPPRYYFRVLPLVNGQLVCQPSNTVSLRIEQAAEVVLPGVTSLPAAPKPPVLYDIQIQEFTPVHFPNYDYQYCVVVKENPYFDPNDPNNLNFSSQPGAPLSVDAVLDQTWGSLAPGTILCPKPYEYKEPSFFEQALNVVKTVVNTVAMIYNTLVNALIDLVAKLNPICLTAKAAANAADAGTSSIEEACHAAAEIAVKAALSYVGLPPSLPNYDELVEVGKGQAVELVAEQFAEQTGVPCIDACKDLIRKGLDEAITAVQDSFSNSACMGTEDAHRLGFEPLCLPPQIKTGPHPESQLNPAFITLQVTRKADVPDSSIPDPNVFDTSCAITVDSHAENTTWVGQQVEIGPEPNGGIRYWQGAPISGQLFQTLYAKLPPLAPGESATLTFPMTDLRGQFPSGQTGFWLPGRLALLQYYDSVAQLESYRPKASDDWLYLYSGAALKLTLKGTCTTSGQGYASGTVNLTGQDLTINLPPAPGK